MRRRPVADFTTVRVNSMNSAHLTTNQTRLTAGMSEIVPGKNSTTPSASATTILRAEAMWKKASSTPEYSRSGPSRISVSASGWSKGGTPSVAGRNMSHARNAGHMTGVSPNEPCSA